MPIDKAKSTTVIDAPFEDVLAAVRDVASQPEWMPDITSAELLEEYEDGTPATARFEMKTKIGSDTYTLAYTSTDSTLEWTLVESTMMKAQNGSYVLQAVGEDSTEVALSLEIDHSIKAPGFLRRSIFNGIVEGSLKGLKGYVES